jgi:DoxX-like family
MTTAVLAALRDLCGELVRRTGDYFTRPVAGVATDPRNTRAPWARTARPPIRPPKYEHRASFPPLTSITAIVDLMFIVSVVVGVLLAVVLAASAWGKVTGDQRVTAGLSTVGVPVSWYRYLAACEAAGALGLLVGLVIPAIGIAAAFGIILYFIGATLAHVRAHDLKGLPAPVVLLALGAVALIARIASM